MQSKSRPHSCQIHVSHLPGGENPPKWNQVILGGCPLEPQKNKHHMILLLYQPLGVCEVQFRRTIFTQNVTVSSGQHELEQATHLYKSVLDSVQTDL